MVCAWRWEQGVEEPDHENVGLGVKMAAIAKKPVCLCYFLGVP